MIKNILSIAGSDPSGGAGVQADLKTFAALGAYGMAAITALTVQNTNGVADIHYVPASFVADQAEAVFKDIRVDAVKIGMPGSTDTVKALARVLSAYSPAHIILDPVMVAGSGDPLAAQETIEVMRDILLPLATLVTPNIPEAEKLLGRAFDGDMDGFARDIRALGAGAVYLKGGHADGEKASDIYMDHEGALELHAPRIDTKNTHGTGCTLSSALAVFFAQGMGAREAARGAKEYITGAIEHADALDVGQGSGPVHHGWRKGERHT